MKLTTLMAALLCASAYSQTTATTAPAAPTGTWAGTAVYLPFSTANGAKHQGVTALGVSAVWKHIASNRTFSFDLEGFGGTTYGSNSVGVVGAAVAANWSPKFNSDFSFGAGFGAFELAGGKPALGVMFGASIKF